MSRLIAIDPDTKTPGVAAFSDGVLSGAFADASAYDFVADYLRRAPFTEPVVLVAECPQTYDGRAARGDPNDLIAVAVCVGRFVQLGKTAGARVLLVTPRAWKGTVRKDITIMRAWEELSATERKVCDLTPQARRTLDSGRGLTDGASCDAMDAVALGLRALGRTGRALV